MVEERHTESSRERRGEEEWAGVTHGVVVLLSAVRISFPVSFCSSTGSCTVFVGLVLR